MNWAPPCSEVTGWGEPGAGLGVPALSVFIPQAINECWLGPGQCWGLGSKSLVMVMMVMAVAVVVTTRKRRRQRGIS